MPNFLIKLLQEARGLGYILVRSSKIHGEKAAWHALLAYHKKVMKNNDGEGVPLSQSRFLR